MENTELKHILIEYKTTNIRLQEAHDKILQLLRSGDQLGCKFCGADNGLRHGHTPDGEPCPMDKTA